MSFNIKIFFLWGKAGLPRLDSPPLPTSAFSGSRTPTSPTLFSAAEPSIFSPMPIRLQPLAPLRAPDSLETWTRSPTKSDVDQVVGSWHLTTACGGRTTSQIFKGWCFMLFITLHIFLVV